MTNQTDTHNQRDTAVNLLIFLTVFATLLGIYSCNKQKQYYIGVSMFHGYSWRGKLMNELQYASFRYGNIRLDTISAGNNGRLQAQHINTMVKNGVELLIVSPIPVPEVIEAVDNAYKKGIPVIVLDNKQVLRNYTAFIGADNRQIGRQVGMYVREILDGKGKVVEIKGKKDDIPTVERHEGFNETVNQSQGIDIVASEYGNWRFQETTPCLEQLTKQHNDIDLVFFHSDGMVPDASFVEMMKQTNPNMKLVSVDALSNDPSGIQLVLDGILTASFVYPTRGDMVLDLATRILKGEPHARETILPTGVVDNSNLQTTLQQHIEINNLDEQISQMRVDMNNMHSSREQQRMINVLLVLIVAMALTALISSYTQLRKIRRLKASLDEQLVKKKEQTRLLQENNRQLKIINRRIAHEAEIKMNFFTNISHEIRTPLTLVMGPVDEMLNDASLSESQKTSLLQLANHNLTLLYDLVNEVLDFQKLQNGMMELRLVNFDLIKALNDWSANFRQMEKEKQVTLSVPSAINSLWVEADRAKMTSIFVNLVGNSFKFTGQGGSISVTVETDGGNPEMMHMKVTDTGCGISHNDMPHIFDKFYQSADTNGGTGIGLSITKSFVEMHNGTISVESETGKGTTFEIAMPLRQTEIEYEPDIVDENTTDDDNQQKDIRPKVLIIEDNSEMRNYIKLILAGKYHTYEADDGLAGYEKAQTIMPDIIICDVMMPVMDGNECCRKLKQTIAVSHIPVILLTARSLDDNKAEGYAAGADSYITKPFQAKLLLSRIKNLLDNRILLRNIFSKEIDAPAGHSHCQRESDFLRRFRDYVNENLSDEQLSVEMMGQHMNISRAQLYSKIKQLTGKSPIEHLRTARLMKAKELLATTDNPVSAIGYDVGFTSPSYFTKCFREEYHMTPNDYRQNHT